MLLLDEPTNHLDAQSIAWLERYLEEYPSTVIAVTHDRYFLDNVAEWISSSIVDTAYPTGGTIPRGSSRKRSASPSRSVSVKRCVRPWSVSSNGYARIPRRARQRARPACSGTKELASKEFQERNETNEIYIPPGERLGDLVVEVKGLRKSYGDRLLIDNLTFNLPRGGIVGIIGPNGAGKTTLFRMLTGVEKPDSGEIRQGPTTKLAYVDQSRQALDDKKTVCRKFPAASTSSKSATTRHPHAATWAGSTSVARNNSR